MGLGRVGTIVGSVGETSACECDEPGVILPSAYNGRQHTSPGAVW